MNELLEQFLVESRELVQAAADDLLALERNPGDPARLDGAFRAVHTLKGSVALFELAPMGAALHAGEDLLEALRRGAAAPDRVAMDTLLALVGASEAWLESFAADGRLPEAAEAEGRALESALRARMSGVAAPSAPPPAASQDWLPALLEREAAAIARARTEGQALTALRYAPSPDCFFLGDDPVATLRALPGPIALHIAPREPWPADGPAPFTCNIVIEAVFAAPEAELRKGLRLVADQVALAPVPVPAPAPSGPGLPAPRGLRVDAARVDALVDLAGELVVARNGLAHLVARVGEENPALARALAESEAGIGRLAERMHRTALGLRLVPLGRAFARLPRLVRETAGGLGKEVTFTVLGEAVEADRTVVDGLFDPLLHLLRNAVDHGIEPTGAREAAGKPRTGRITLSAAREDGGVAVTLSDDGAGMDPARLRAVAKARGVADAATIDALDDREALDLVFRPGFSTAGAVTAISGRGVGMDAVRAAVEALGGRVTLSSIPGQGTSVRLLLPGGAAVMGVLTVRAGGELYGIPAETVAETARLPKAAIQPLGAGEAFVLRGRTLPVLRLAALLGLEPAPRGATARLLVTGGGTDGVALEVEGFGGRLDVLLRPPQGLLRGLPGLVGTALLGDGSALLVLDLPDLLARAGAA
ncbi:chemotaxis protein CheA [Pararoseomonas indoligenes]|uniref:Chemotaxis protein CheA n=1 Tax=Roseomonas indoligenes TaxID=2820811 RepID=A0A940N457_9PROT|nr:chemotaxis protein CheA [Pararoseomonas indoligenes]MBP0496455.1 chemotaxis protein CheA [Pararoseomonas indoligenes]